jgi:hypothetical protein
MAKGSKTTREQNIALKIIDLLSDLRIDLDMIGLYFGRYARTVVYNRLQHIAEVARHHKEKQGDIKEHYEYIRNITN